MKTINITLTFGEAFHLLSAAESLLERYIRYGSHVKNRKLYERMLDDQRNLVRKIREAYIKRD